MFYKLNKIITCALMGAFFLQSGHLVQAHDLVINEVMANPSGPSSEESEFVELFNKSEAAINVKGYKIADLVKEFEVGEATISAKGFWVISKLESGISLNNSSETVRLIDKNGLELDSFSYKKTVEDKSFSRIPDGTGAFVSETEITKGKNNQPNPSPSLISSSPSPSSDNENSNSPSPSPSSLVSPLTTAMSSESSLDQSLISSPKVSSIKLLASKSGEVLGEKESTESGKLKNPYWLSLGLIGVGGVILILVGVEFVKIHRV